MVLKKKGTPGRKKLVKKVCDNCKREISNVHFYNSNSVFTADGKVNVCKDCIKSMIDYRKMESVYKILQLLDIPFLYNYWRTAMEKNPEDPWAIYIRIANSKFNAFKDKTWANSVFEPEVITPGNLKMDKFLSSISNFSLTQEIIARWGSKYEVEDYASLENFYHNMRRDNKIETAQEESYLRKLAVISLKLDKALEDDDFEKAKNLGNLFSKYMADSQFRAMDKTEADKTGGIRTFSQIYAEVEKEDFIPPWEYYRKIKGITQDIVDDTIMHIENFTLRLNKISTMSEPPIDTPKIDDSGENNVV